MRLFSWLHFADLHFGEGPDPWSNELLLACLREDAASLCATEGRPDAIFVAGDVVQVRRDDERRADAIDRSYELAKIWLSELGRAVSVPPARVFIVPGSLDVRPAGPPRARSVNRLVERLRDGSEALDDALADEDDRALLLSRLSHFARFAEAFGPPAKAGSPAPPAEGAEGLSYSCRITSPAGLSARVVGLTTGLLRGEGDDRGRLRVGVGQLGAALRAHGDGELLVVLSHHPFQGGWLADEQAAAAWLESRAPIHLTACAGEDRSVRALRGPERGLIRVAAGSVGGDMPGGRCYNFASVGLGDDGALELRVWHRRWSGARKAFVADVDAIPQGQWFASYPLEKLSNGPGSRRLVIAPEPRPSEDLRDDFRTRSELLEGRIRNAVEARGPEAAREAALLLEKELHRYVASVDDDLKRARAGRDGPGADADIEASLHAEIRDLRRRARCVLARVKLGVMLDAAGGAPADEREVFACSGALVALGGKEDIELLRRAEERWPLDFLPAHREALEERTSGGLTPSPPKSGVLQ